MDAPRSGEPWEYSDIDDRGGLLRLEDDRADHVTLFGNVGGGLTGVERSFTWAPTIANGRGDTSATP